MWILCSVFFISVILAFCIGHIKSEFNLHKKIIILNIIFFFCQIIFLLYVYFFKNKVQNEFGQFSFLFIIIYTVIFSYGSLIGAMIFKVKILLKE
jgi:hypothetical protein